VGLLALLAVVAGPARLAETLSGASPAWISLVALLACAWLLLGALNVWLLLRRLVSVKLGLFTRAYVASWAASLVIPGQLGDVTQVVLLRRAGVPVASSGAAYLLDKLVSLTWLAVVAAYGVGRYTEYHPAIWLLAASLVAAAVVVAVLLLLRLQVASQAWLLKGQSVARRAISQLLVFRAHPALVGTNLVLTVAKWLLTTALYLAAFRAVGAWIGFEAAATIPVMSSLVGYLPLTVAGIGSMELTAVVLFATVGVDAARVLGAYLLLRGVLVIVAALLLALIEVGKRRAAAA
jgi:uncharacterized membrane protein YbhN (UPF0104 family)